MKEFTVTGSVTLEGVRFYVKSKTLEGALARLAMGDYDSHEESTAEVVDHHVALSTIEENS